MVVDAFGWRAFEAVMARAEPALTKRLQEAGVSTLLELPPDQAMEMVNEIIFTTVANTVQGADLRMLAHFQRAISRPRFMAALSRVHALAKGPWGDVFAPTVGIDAAIYLAGLGYAVLPLDKQTFRPLAPASSDIDEVIEYFGRFKSALVGYPVGRWPFYILTTDCLRTLARMVPTHPALTQVRKLIERSKTVVPNETKPFVHGMLLIPRYSDDRISMIGLMDPRPDVGSIALFAGWEGQSSIEGMPPEHIPVPLRFVLNTVEDPELALWVWRPLGDLEPAMN